MYGQKSISQSLLDAVNSAMSEDIHPQAQMLLKHIKPEHHAVYKPFLAKKVFNGSFKDKTDVLHAAKQAGHLVSENIEEIIEGFKELMQDVKDRAGPQPKGHIGQKAGTRYGGAGQKDDEREKETERLDNKKKAMKKESFGDFKDRLIESLKGKQKNIDKNKNNKIDAHDFEILRAQKEEVEELDEISTKTLASAAKSASDPDSDYHYGKSHDSQKFADHAKKTKDAKSAAAVQGAADAKSHYPRPGHSSGSYDTLADRTKSRITSAGKVNKQDVKTLKGKIRQSYQNEDVEQIDEIVYEANIQPTSAKSRSHIGNLSNPVTNSVVHPSSGKEIGLITKQPNGEYHAHHSAAKMSHSQSSTFDNKDKAHQFIRNAHAKAIKSGTLSDRFLKKQPLAQFAKEEVEDVNEVMDEPNYKNSIQARQAAADKDFKARQARLAAAGKETAKDPERLKRLSSIPGYTAAMDLAKKTTKEEVELDEAGEVKLPSKGLTVDTLAGPKKAPKGFEKDNEHTSAKVPLKTEDLDEKYTAKELKMAGGIAKDKRYAAGNMTGASKIMDKIKPGLSQTKQAQKALRQANEGKRPESDTVPFVTDSVQSPKERLRAALGRVKKEMSSGY